MQSYNINSLSLLIIAEKCREGELGRFSERASAWKKKIKALSGEDLFWKQFSCGWVTKPNLGLLARYMQQSQSTYTKLWWKTVEPLIVSCPVWSWARRPSSSCSKHLNSLMALREEFLKTVWGKGLQGDWSVRKHSFGLLVVRELHSISGVNIIPSSPNWSGGSFYGPAKSLFHKSLLHSFYYWENRVN